MDMKLLNGRYFILPVFFFTILVGFSTGVDDAMIETSDEGKIKWLVSYDGSTLPQEQGWATVGKEGIPDDMET